MGHQAQRQRYAGGDSLYLLCWCLHHGGLMRPPSGMPASPAMHQLMIVLPKATLPSATPFTCPGPESLCHPH